MTATVHQFPARRAVERELTVRELTAPHPAGLGMSERWVRYRVKEGLPHRVHWDGSYRFLLSECRVWLENRRSA